MADIEAFTLSVPDLTCKSDLSAWAAELVSDLQAGIDHVIAGIADYEQPECDICVLKDDLVDCPLTANMIDFTSVTYGEDGDVGVLPGLPSGILDIRYGTVATLAKQSGAWQSRAVTFDTPFDSECVYVRVQITAAYDAVPTPGINNARYYSPIVQEETITVNGFTVWFYNTETTASYTYFRYIAYGN